ncbi:MAG: dCMP deaminase family protein [Gammaproteobacteria bacterium]
MNRISKIDYYLGIAEAVSKRSTCLRRQYGAILVKNDEIIATGYNGSPRNSSNCCDIGKCWREENNIPHGEKYEACLAVHAEQNAIISASRRDIIGSTLYLVGFENGKKIPAEEIKPCKICEKMIINSGIAKVVTKEEEGVYENRTI